MKEWSREFRTCLEQVIIDLVIQENFRVWERSTNAFPLRGLQQIPSLAFQFNNITVLHQPFKYRTCITMHMKCVVVERAEELRSGAKHVTFSMKRLGQVLQCDTSSDMIYVIGEQRMKRKRHTETSFDMEMNSRELTTLKIYLFHAVNVIGIFMKNILERASCNGYEGVCSVLRQTCFIPN